MGQKGSKSNKNNKDKKKLNNSASKNDNNIIDDDFDFKDEFKISNINNDKSETCPNCKKVFPTNTVIQNHTWSLHKKSCKPKNISPNNNIINNINPPPLDSTTEKKCPNCKIMFKYTTQYYINLYNQHIKRCRPYNHTLSFQNYYSNSNSNLPAINGPIRINAYNQGLNNVLDTFGLETKKILPRGKKDGTFEEKVDYLRYDISKKKIDFINGAEKLSINREKVLENSMEQFKTINLFKELKILFLGEESHDAGGLIREWLTILFNKILDEETGLFEKSDTEEIGYLVKKNIFPSQENLDTFYFIGRVLAKALLENLTINCCFNKVIYQLILGEKIQLNDLVFIDRPLYKSMI